MASSEQLKLAYTESIRALTQQAQVLDNLRARTGVLFTGASIASSFLGAQALPKNGLTCWAVAALVSLLLLGLSVLAVLIPRRGWEFGHNIGKLLKNFEDEPSWADLDGTHRRLAKINDTQWVTNEKKLKWMFRMFNLGSILLIAEIAFWLIDLGAAE